MGVVLEKNGPVSASWRIGRGSKTFVKDRKKWSCGRAARQSSAKAPTPVQIWSGPRNQGSRKRGPFFILYNFTVTAFFSVFITTVIVSGFLPLYLHNIVNPAYSGTQTFSACLLAGSIISVTANIDTWPITKTVMVTAEGTPSVDLLVVRAGTP